MIRGQSLIWRTEIGIEVNIWYKGQTYYFEVKVLYGGQKHDFEVNIIYRGQTYDVEVKIWYRDHDLKSNMILV